MSTLHPQTPLNQSMNSILLLVALWGRHASCQMTLSGFALEDGPIDSQTLRGDPRGNIWNTPVPGSNILECGVFGNQAYYGIRVEVSAGLDSFFYLALSREHVSAHARSHKCKNPVGGKFQLHGNIFIARQNTGSVYLSIKYVTSLWDRYSHRYPPPSPPPPPSHKH